MLMMLTNVNDFSKYIPSTSDAVAPYFELNFITCDVCIENHTELRLIIKENIFF